MQLRATRAVVIEPDLPAPLAPLLSLAGNLAWTWFPGVRRLFDDLFPALWEATGHNPVRVLQLASTEHLDSLAGDAIVVERVAQIASRLEGYLAGASASEHAPIAYFSLEFSLAESLPIYSGGLGVLAGDHLKSASDLALPLVAVGLFYHEGYFQQALGPDGWQHEEYSDLDPAEQPLKVCRSDDGSPVEVELEIDGRPIWLKVWEAQVGRIPLFLLDANHVANSHPDRQLTARLYGGDLEMRIQQEIVVGIGGLRLLHLLGRDPAVCHMNEGHSALLGLERTRILMEAHQLSFEEARLPVAASTVFTTHTAVAAGIDLFPPELVRRYLAPYYRAVGLDDNGFLALGRINRDDDSEAFSMALLGLRMSDWRNGVSQLHGAVSRRLWETAWPRLPLEQVPIQAITNGVHLPSWVGPQMGDLFETHLGEDWRDRSRDPETWSLLRNASDQEIWQARSAARRDLVDEVRHRLESDALNHGRSRSDVVPLDPDALTIGFARRFAQYKRATLLFRDPSRLAAILHNAERPVQFLFAGKAHPRDNPAKQLIREVVEFTRRREFRDRMVVLERYDTNLAKSLVSGCDIWLNTPLRPLEASGTSGMKAVANGAIHVSTLDGWWAEAYRPECGWAVGSTRPFAEQGAQDANDAEALYSLLEGEIANSFYGRDQHGIPRDWVNRIRNSITAYAPVFNTDRMVTEYSECFYEPATRAWERLTSSGGQSARELSAWLRRVNRDWTGVKLLAVEDNLERRNGDAARITASLFPGALVPDDLRVEVCLGHANQQGDLVAEKVMPMELEERQDDGVCRYAATLDRMPGGRRGYVVRVMPAHADLTASEDLGLVLWS